jgi:Protein of unknown function (DUF2785)
MDTQFWISLSKNDYRVPSGTSLEKLTEILFSYLGSPDPELRDGIAYIIYANWLKREMYSNEELKSHVDRLLSNLDKGIGETESDTVFLRSFSVLVLAEIVHNDNKKGVRDKDHIKRIISTGLWYLEAEQDPRGYIPVKGWAHALAHTADLLLVLARNRNIDEADLLKMLFAISTKIVQSTNHVYIHGEDERLASAVQEIFRREVLPLDKVEDWTKSFIEPNGQGWKGAYVEEERNRAFQNTRNLLRSIYLALVTQPGEFPDREGITGLVLDAIHALRPY